MHWGKHMLKRSLLALAIAGALSTTAAAAAPSAAPSNEEMWRIIQEQQREIEALKQQLKTTDQRVHTTTQQVEATSRQVEETTRQVEATAEVVEKGGSEKLAKAAEWINNTSIGGYAELHYNNLNNKSAGADKNEIDFHRFVLFVNHRFSDRTRFFSELELEHSIAGEGKAGEIELEQAYIEHDLTATGSQRMKAGLFLMPIGILNETHEPDTFYGVERNNVESAIVPSTWWEGGLAASGEIATGLSYDAAVTSGLGLATNRFKVRDGRQKVGSAKSDALAYTGRIKYTGIPGLELASSVQYQDDLYQEELVVAGTRRAVNAWLYEAHAAYQTKHFGLRALYAQWDIDDDIEAISAGASQQNGWYVEPSWRLNEQWGVFARYSEWDNQAAGSADTGYEQFDYGVNFWLEPNVVFKLDIQDQHAPDGQSELDGFNLGLGWSF